MDYLLNCFINKCISWSFAVEYESIKMDNDRIRILTVYFLFFHAGISRKDPSTCISYRLWTGTF